MSGHSGVATKKKRGRGGRITESALGMAGPAPYGYVEILRNLGAPRRLSGEPGVSDSPRHPSLVATPRNKRTLRRRITAVYDVVSRPVGIQIARTRGCCRRTFFSEQHWDNTTNRNTMNKLSVCTRLSHYFFFCQHADTAWRFMFALIKCGIVHCPCLVYEMMFRLNMSLISNGISQLKTIKSSAWPCSSSLQMKSVFIKKSYIRMSSYFIRVPTWIYFRDLTPLVIHRHLPLYKHVDRSLYFISQITSCCVPVQLPSCAKLE